MSIECCVRAAVCYCYLHIARTLDICMQMLHWLCFFSSSSSIVFCDALPSNHSLRLTNSRQCYCDAVQFDDRKFCFWLIMRKFFFFVTFLFSWSKGLRAYTHNIFPEASSFIFIHVSSS